MTVEGLPLDEPAPRLILAAAELPHEQLATRAFVGDPKGVRGRHQCDFLIDFWHSSPTKSENDTIDKRQFVTPLCIYA